MAKTAIKTNPVVLKALRAHPEVVKRLKRVAEDILAEPLGYNQNTWLSGWGDGRDTNPVATCGAACCIAGWYAFEAGYRQAKNASTLQPNWHKGMGVVLPTFPADILARDLNVSRDHVELLVALATSQPATFCARFARAQTPAAKARVGAARIAHFLKTGI